MDSVMPMVCLRYQCHPLKDVESAAVDPQILAPMDLACLVLNVLKEHDRASLGAQAVKNLPAMPETQVQFLGQEDLLEEGMATHSSILAWEIPWTEEPGG